MEEVEVFLAIYTYIKSQSLGYWYVLSWLSSFFHSVFHNFKRMQMKKSKPICLKLFTVSKSLFFDLFIFRENKLSCAMTLTFCKNLAFSKCLLICHILSNMGRSRKIKWYSLHTMIFGINGKKKRKMSTHMPYLADSLGITP